MDAFPKIIAIDANVLICNCQGAGDRKEKVSHLLAAVDKAKGKVLIPTPAIAEYLVRADRSGLATLEALQKKASVQVADLNLAAAYEAAQMDAAALGRGDKRDGSDQSWQKIKVDRQIVAIAKAHGAQLVISDDPGVRDAAMRIGMKSLAIDDLPLPDHARQAKLPIVEPSA
jgi:predicted nucleic acid-binding protein